MIKHIFIILTIFLASGVSAKTTKKWKKHYNLVLSDIKSVETLGTRDLGLRIRLFELYGEKLTLLLEKESELRIQFLRKGDPKKLNSLVRKQKKALKTIESIATKIEKQTKDRKILAKINYFRSLNYYITKNYKKFYIYVKKAERFNKDKEFGYLINTKIADYHFNEKQYKQASKYYKRLLYNKKSGWITKHYYNLSWAELKLNRYSKALKYLKVAARYEKQKNGFFKIGDQLVNSLLLFHAYSKKTKEGIKYFDKIGISSFENLLKYLHYVFENGDKNNIDIVFNRIEKLKLNKNQQFILLSKKVLVYRTLKRFGKLQKKFHHFKKTHARRKGKVEQKSREDLITATRSYTGFLQELVRSKRLISEKNRRRYLFYIGSNFSVLRSIDRKNALKYTYFEGETYFSIQNYKRAVLVYVRGIKEAKKYRKGKDPNLVKIFDSLFKSLEKQEKRSTKTLIYTYSSYLAFFPNGAKANQVNQRLLNIYQSKGDSKKMLASLKSYNKLFPIEVKIQRDFYKNILNKYIDLKNVSALASLKILIDKGFLGFTKNESRKVEKVITQIYFSKYEDMAKKGQYEEAIAGFDKLFNDKKSKYVLRIDSLRKKMFYENKILKYVDLSKSLISAFSFFNTKNKKKHKQEILFYVQNICLGDMHEECRALVARSFKDKTIKVSGSLKNLYFKLSAIYSKSLVPIYKNAKSKEDKNYLFKLLLAQDSEYISPLYNEFYKDKKKRLVIEGEVSKRVLNKFYDSLDISASEKIVSKISIKSLKNKILREFKQLRVQLPKINFIFPATPKDEDISEMVFMKFGQSFDALSVKLFQKIDSVINTTPPNYIPFVLSRIISRFDVELEKFKNFIPVSKNADLEKAMSDAVTNFQKIYDKKAISYRALYFQSIGKTAYGSGVKIYNNEIITKPLQRGYGSLELWQE